MWGKRFANVFLGVTCFAMLVKGNPEEVESHYLDHENSTATIENPGKREIHIGAFVPYMRGDRWGYYTAMKMAINLINKRTDILGSYTLVLDPEETYWVSAEIRLFLLSIRIISLLPPFSLIRDFGLQNTSGNVSKLSVNLTCNRHIGSRSTNRSPLA